MEPEGRPACLRCGEACLPAACCWRVRLHRPKRICCRPSRLPRLLLPSEEEPAMIHDMIDTVTYAPDDERPIQPVCAPAVAMWPASTPKTPQFGICQVTAESQREARPRGARAQSSTPRLRAAVSLRGCSEAWCPGCCRPLGPWPAARAVRNASNSSLVNWLDRSDLPWCWPPCAASLVCYGIFGIRILRIADHFVAPAKGEDVAGWSGCLCMHLCLCLARLPLPVSSGLSCVLSTRRGPSLLSMFLFGSEGCGWKL